MRIELKKNKPAVSLVTWSTPILVSHPPTCNQIEGKSIVSANERPPSAAPGGPS
ncbi:hypothetical protein IBE48_09455 [Francisella philomiragia]|uniref:Uncharacterized protein n=1 Tax=Francisella philomiragia TaxID=28110 RepID=A0AAW3D9M3_9GAMM|nr:hypothetical protein [Francisella philomiragia]KFJ42037.1 hypothetical protein DR78_427 [Francisella philomiragia]MBK2255673.1 hypothetical protein [Francisella philomiragia]MBK2273988.1 hypothetical protein [Francisella philomiragia]MBK2277829.1 hypothetical protein [Francisella philomiragia]MBK2281775.1 hypothetical protein [Francisella philomiragia]